MRPADRPPLPPAPPPSPSGTGWRLPIALSLAVSSLLACTDRAGDLRAGSAAGAPTGVSAGTPSSVTAAAGTTSDALRSAPDVVFRTLSGERLALADATGPTLVNFWSTSCAVCLHEMPELARLRADYAPRGFELVAVAMPYDRPDAVLELAEARGWSFPVALDIDGAVLAAFEPVPGTPTSFLIDADGLIVERRVGPVDVEALRERLDALPIRSGSIDALARPAARSRT